MRCATKRRIVLFCGPYAEQRRIACLRELCKAKPHRKITLKPGRGGKSAGRGGMMATGTVIYKCSCGAYHPWAFDGDCRDDDNRYTSPEEYAEGNNLDPDDVEVRAIDAEDDEVDEDEDDKTDEDDDDGDNDDDDDKGGEGD